MAFTSDPIIVPWDFSDLSRQALKEAIELADSPDAWLPILAAAHAEGIVHRDLKAKNVLVARVIMPITAGSRSSTSAWRSSPTSPPKLPPPPRRRRSPRKAG